MINRVDAKTKFYFPELDGLRLIAFLLVFIHHAPKLDLPGFRFISAFGWIGVDLFFALSAFLFVKLLHKEFNQTGSISIKRFYIRRGLRIWPLYFVFCISMIVLSGVHGNLNDLSWRALGLLTFTDNIVCAYKGYNPILYSDHLWTISYEEQFYVVIFLTSLCITVAVASVSYTLIEKPFLKLKKRFEVIASRPA